MKPNLLVCLFLLSSCALYHEITSPPTKSKSPPGPQATKETPPLQVESRSVRSTDGGAKLIIYPSNTCVVLKTNTMSYREGHSVEIKTNPGTFSIHRVLPTDNNIVQFANSDKIMELINGKKSVEIELYLDDSGLKIFTFNL